MGRAKNNLFQMAQNFYNTTGLNFAGKWTSIMDKQEDLFTLVFKNNNKIKSDINRI